MRWPLVVPPGLVAVLVLARFTVPAWTVSPAVSVDKTQHDRIGTAQRALTSAWRLDGTSLSDLLDQFDRGDLAVPFVLLGGLFTALYIVVRPLASAYRVQRATFNLGTEEDGRQDRSTGSWHQPRSTGVYELERAAFARVDAAPAKPFNLDLWIGLLGATISATFFSTWWFRNSADDFSDYWDLLIMFEGSTVALFVLRLAWLYHQARCRADRPGAWLAPTGVAVPCGERVGEVRDVRETAGWSLAWIFVSLGMMPPLPVWFRLATEVRMLRRAQVVAARVTAAKLPRASRWRAALSVLSFLLLPPVAVASHLWRLTRLERPHARSTARLALLVAPTLLAASWFDFWFWVVNPDQHLYRGFLPYAATMGMAIALIQREHNWLLRHVGTPLPYDDNARTAPSRPQTEHGEPTPATRSREQVHPLPPPTLPAGSGPQPPAVPHAG